MDAHREGSGSEDEGGAWRDAYGGDEIAAAAGYDWGMAGPVASLLYGYDAEAAREGLFAGAGHFLGGTETPDGRFEDAYLPYLRREGGAPLSYPEALRRVGDLRAAGRIPPVTAPARGRRGAPKPGPPAGGRRGVRGFAAQAVSLESPDDSDPDVDDVIAARGVPGPAADDTFEDEGPEAGPEKTGMGEGGGDTSSEEGAGDAGDAGGDEDGEDGAGDGGDGDAGDFGLGIFGADDASSVEGGAAEGDSGLPVGAGILAFTRSADPGPSEPAADQGGGIFAYLRPA